MHTDRHDLLDYDKWNRSLLNLYWVCNAIILAVEIIVGVMYSGTPYIPPPKEYFCKFIFLPSILIFLLTALCESAVYVLRRGPAKYIFLKPYVVTFTCVAFCAVLLIVHYSVTVVFVVYVIPVFFSLVYNSGRVLLCTFIFSFLVFIGVCAGYFMRADLPYLSVTVADIPSTIAILAVAYIISRTILNRNCEVIAVLAEAEHMAYESKAAKDRAEARAEARGLFLANMSHEMRTPLNGILGLTELTLDDGGLSGEQRDCLLKIKRSANGLLAIINDILDISKIDAGETSLEIIPFGLDAVLNECRAIISQRAKEKGLRLYFRDETRLEQTLMGDPTKLRQALLNFLSNAVKFTAEGSVTLLVRQVGEINENNRASIYFEVSDTGIGMTEEQLTRVFEPFHQADHSITRSFGGTGLGLSIAKTILEMMGAEIDVRSIPDMGSRFSFLLEFPICDGENVPLKAQDAELERPVFAGDALLCEDDPINQQVAIRNLEKLGLCVTLAENGRLGVEEALRREEEKRPFDVILMDIHMPVMDGLHAAKKLAEAGVKTPIIAISANLMPEDADKYADAGMVGCIGKPFQARELWACLVNCMTPIDTCPAAEPKSCPEISGDDMPPVNEALGTEHFAGSREAFAAALVTFTKKYADSPAELNSAIADGDFKLARSIVHAQRGAAAVIGAEALRGILGVLEDNLRNEVVPQRGDLEKYGLEHSRVLAHIEDAGK